MNKLVLLFYWHGFDFILNFLDMEPNALSLSLTWREHWLSQNMLLRGLPPALLRLLAVQAMEKRLGDRQVLFALHAPADSLALVVDGQIHHFLASAAGKELIVGASCPGQSAGAFALLGHKERLVEARAAGSTRVLLLRRQYFPALLREPLFQERLNGWLLERVEECLALIEGLALCSLEARLARHVLRGLRWLEGEMPSFVLPAPQKVLAQMLNATRQRLNIQLREWVREGLVHIRRNCLFVDDLAEIHKRAQLLEAL
jgi:CRP-like cAMP-binding protein